ncbi:MAG: hypothetical protein KF691_11775 [Phycisphaeraceae bacterium]|nr:hypothetical protein [Phycisphaeraceae bacterium]
MLNQDDSPPTAGRSPSNGPSRSTFRRVIRWFCVSVIVATLGVVAAVLIWVWHWERQIGGDNTDTRMQASEIVSEAQGSFADEANRWSELADILATYEQLQSEFQRNYPAPKDSAGFALPNWVPDASMAYDPSSSPEQSKAGAEFLARLDRSGLLARQEFFERAKHFERPIDAPRLIDATFLDLTVARRLARADRALLFRLWKSGGAQDKEAARVFEWLLALGRAYRYQFGAINSLTGIAIQVLALDTIREVCMNRPLREDALALCLAAMERQLDAPERDFALRCERILVLDTVQWSFSDDGRGDGYFLAAENFDLGALTGNQARKTATGEGFFLASKKELVDKFDELFGADIEKSLRLPRDRTAAAWNDPVEGLPRRFRILKILYPAPQKLIAAQDQLMGEVIGTKTLLAIELFRLRNNRLPGALSELVPGILAELPLDPYASGTLRYKQTDPSEDPCGRDYLLYTVGSDRTDNDAKMNVKVPFTPLIGAPSGKGFDFVFNTPDPDLQKCLNAD